MDIKVSSEVLRLGLSVGYFSVQDAVKWADNLIGNLESPPYEIIEVSLSANKKPVDICSILLKLNGNFDEEISIKVMLGLLQNYLIETKDYENVWSWVYRLNEYIPLSYDWILNEIIYLSNAIYLAEQDIYGDVLEVKKELLVFLGQFEKYSNYI
ncbi:hypothetical protein ACFWM3_14330 [Gottfriedia sp. NPDC058432]|uniref:hypothetical protein n=1 Tax=Gottfriedia sp. NPDC058432 TaxID=3346497 RepID=UPI00365906D1